MKNIFSKLSASVAICAVGVAAQGSVHLLSGTSFSAPNVNGVTNVGNPQTGDLVFDISNNEFYGYGGSSPGWIALGGSASSTPPTKGLCVSGTYTTHVSPAPLYIKVRMVGGGGGGGGSGLNGTGAGPGGTGGATTFGTSMLVANGGIGGVFGDFKGTLGGSASLGSVAIGNAVKGGDGNAPSIQSSGATAFGGGGGSSYYGGAGGASQNGDALPGAPDSGGGGGGAGSVTAFAVFAGAGGGAGGFVEATITNPNSSYPCSVGAGGAGGAAGSYGSHGGAGGSGNLTIEEYYQ